MDGELETSKARKLLITFALFVVALTAVLGGAIGDRLFGFRPLDKYFPNQEFSNPVSGKAILTEENVVVSVAEKSSPSVVTISAETPKRKTLQFSPFGGFDVSDTGGQQDLATGFIVASDGLIVTNKHVVSLADVTYKVITKDNKEYEVKNIYRDPTNDLALIKIEIKDAPVLELGDSDQLKVGQFAIAIGTALGEFRHTVTTGVISGLGRGITAGSPFEGYAEQIDNVIQTDAAINPGNSGGPLLDSKGLVIGVNVAVAQGAQNIGFALPINILKKSLEQFKQTGEFHRPFLGVRYVMISQEAAIQNEIPQGAYVQEIVEGSPAAKAGIQLQEIITKMDGKTIKEKEGGLASLINQHKVGDTISLEVWTERETRTVNVTLTEATE
ncbi:MAG: trypsin-like peptidase domain-containing protein [bacterium]|nr:trypsin-like peptidase domain-containing protein [bacterium]